MPNWNSFSNYMDVRAAARSVAHKIRSNEIDVGRQHYALGLLHGVIQAVHCGYEKIVAVELGVAGGGGLLELCKAADFFRTETGIEIEVYGFDNATGLPPGSGHKDHPEIWRDGQFSMGDPNNLIAKLPDFAHLIIGDVEETIKKFEYKIFGSRLGFVSIDLDYYSSTKSAMGIFEMHPLFYVPALPVYLDDIEVLITYNPWCGEEKAVEEFNQSHEFRKIHRKPNFAIHNFSVCQILDHPIRTGEIQPRFQFEIGPF